MHRTLVLKTGGESSVSNEIGELLAELGIVGKETAFERSNGAAQMTFDLKYAKEIPTQQLIDQLEKIKDLKILSVGHTHLGRHD